MARGTHLLAREEGLEKIASGEIPMESFYMQPGDVTVRSPILSKKRKLFYVRDRLGKRIIPTSSRNL
ncbi:hypothetical protein [Anabaena azotica]|uniref:hypothetical protein n=1 Tax=Anabaena azotica TaxID=197653 RepID=UPI0039A62131